MWTGRLIMSGARQRLSIAASAVVLVALFAPVVASPGAQVWASAGSGAPEGRPSPSEGRRPAQSPAPATRPQSPATAPTRDKTPEAKEPARTAVAVEGFRSAAFGMKEDAVRQAIAKDFPAQAKSITLERHPVERTRALLITVPDLLPGTGPARIAYILGYRSEALMQVNIAWGTAVDPSATPDQMVDAARVLSNYLRNAGYDPGGVLLDRGLPDGSLLVFRGSDAQGRTTSLLLRGSVSEGESNRQLRPSTLLLSYARDPNNSDVFRIEKGQF